MANTLEFRSARKTTMLITYGLILSGLFLMMLSVLGSENWHWDLWVTSFVRDIGLLLAAVMAGTILHEKLLRDETLSAFLMQLDHEMETKIPKSSDIAHMTAIEVHRLLSEQPPMMKGIRFVSERRRNYAGYYNWVIDQRPQELFFAGRSVLHRIDADVRTRTGVPAEEVILRKLKEGSKVWVAFLDPRAEVLDRLAREEGQQPEAMLGDIATSLGICRRLFSLIQDNYRTLKAESELIIRIYNRVPYFAYHRQDEQVIVGFYFLSDKGYTSAAYELIDEQTKQVFGDHFARIMADAASNTLVSFDGTRGRPTSNDALFHGLYDCLSERLGKEKTDELVLRSPVLVGNNR